MSTVPNNSPSPEQVHADVFARGRLVGISTRQADACVSRIDRSGPLTAASIARVQAALDRHPMLSDDGSTVTERR